MKKSFAVLIIILITFAACSRNLTDKGDIVSLFHNNETMFLQAADSGDWTAIERLNGVRLVYPSAKCVDIQCGGAGFASNTHYYGIFYSAEDDLCAIWVSGPAEELVAQGDGYLYEQTEGDNRSYIEPLGNHFYYYEGHF